MIRHIDDDSILVHKTLCDTSHDGVIIVQRVVVMRQDLFLFVIQFWTIIHLGGKDGLCLLRITGPIIHMRTHQVENYQIVPDGGVFQCIVFFQHPIVKAMRTRVPTIKLPLAQFWVIEEEATTEIIDSLLSLWLKLVGDECHVIACFAEHLWEKWFVAPFATIANGIE